jgi:hypothetical protein
MAGAQEMSNYTGVCACGAVSADIRGKPATVRQCWCTQCQKLATGSACTNAMFNTADVEMHGALATHSYVAASGNTLTHSFCATCGTPVMAQSSARPQFMTLRVGFIAQPHELAPQAIIWTQDAPAWAVWDESLEVHEGQPPSPVTR